MSRRTLILVFVLVATTVMVVCVTPVRGQPAQSVHREGFEPVDEALFERIARGARPRQAEPTRGRPDYGQAPSTW